ncbi:MAG: S41 family peptidase [Flavobacteriales bacterium]|nr:S41 family peptidase [Flavobacteriales bacterium]
MNRLKKQYQPIAFSIVLIIGVLIGDFLNNTNNGISNFQIHQNSKINTILQLIQQDYVDTINPKKIEESAINSILKELDPHSTYINTKKIKGVNQEMEGSFGGVGVEFNIQNDSIVVVSPISGGPSQRLGIKSGDRIVLVNDENVAGIGIENQGVIDRLRGEIGTKVKVGIKRKNEKEIIDYSITRGEIPLFSLDVKLMLTNDIGYIKLNRFSGTTTDEFMEATQLLLSSGMQNLILDLRGNPGGYLQEAINISNEFLDRGKMIVFTKGRNRKKQEFYANKSGLLTKMKVVVLVDEGSASASEIVAGALQDNDRAKIIGRRTYGKGLVQEQIPLMDGSVVRLTTQRYYTPTGRSIQKPYEKGKDEDYFLEVYEREKEDTISIVDSFVFTTPKGKKVYGGGGITPDYLVPIDTILDSKKMSIFFRKNWIFDFCFDYADRHRETLTKKQLLKRNVYLDFVSFVNDKTTEFVFDLNGNEIAYLEKQIRASIGRNLFGNEFFYSILLQKDRFVERAIKEL